MKFSLDRSIEILSSTPYVLEALLTKLSDQWLYGNEGHNTWHPVEIVIHLILAERTNWLPRMNTILSKNGSRALNTFTRTDELGEYSTESLIDLLTEFKELRLASVAILRSKLLTPSELDKTGIHPVFGAVTLAQMIAAWTVHDLNHLAQLSRVLASQYKDEVGPWVQYLSILKK